MAGVLIYAGLACCAVPAGVAMDEADAASGAAINSTEALMNAKIAFFMFDPSFNRR